MRTSLAVLTIVVLAGCSKPSPAALQAAAPAPAEAAAAAANETPAKSATPANDAAATPMLAYSYDYGLVAPPDQIRGLQARHEQACVAAGPAVCQVTGSNIASQGKDDVHATLTLRAVPAWLARFRDGLGKDAEGVGGRLAHATTASEDLSRQMVDTEAAVRAKTALRDRLQKVLETRQGTVADLVSVEKTLADVQGELDATQLELAVMRQRVATSDLSIDYRSASGFASGGVWAPLGSAAHDFLRNLVAAAALIVDLVAWLAPWAVVIGGAIWLARRQVWRRPAPKTNKPAPPPGP
jgi:hypothetical protein